MQGLASATYHLICAYRHSDAAFDPVDTLSRRVDQSMQLLNAVPMLHAVAGATPLFGLDVFLFAYVVYSLCALWHPATTNDRRRWRSIYASGMMCAAPALLRGDVRNFTAAAVSFTVSGTLAFVPYVSMGVLRGWGHCAFHLVLCVYVEALAQSILAPQAVC